MYTSLALDESFNLFLALKTVLSCLEKVPGEQKVPLAAEADGWVSKVTNHRDRLKL